MALDPLTCIQTGCCRPTAANDPSRSGRTRRWRSYPSSPPHGHVDPALLLGDEPFSDPTSLLIQPDHYVTRLLPV